MPALTVVPNPAAPSTVVTIQGTGFANAKTRLLLDGAGATTNIFRPSKAGDFTVGITVASSVKTQTLVAQQASGSTWSEKARTSISVIAVVQPPPTSTYTFEDTFTSGMSPKWVPIWGPGDTGDRLDTDQQHSVTIAQTSVANGILTMAAERKATPSGRPYAGAAWATYGTFSQKFGTWEVRLRYDECKGSFPSWFLLPAGQKGPYPEIDVFEAYGDSACQGVGFVGTAVSTSATVNDHHSFIVVPAPSNGWHTHKMIWTSTRLDFFIDGVATWSVTDPAKISQVPMYPIFTWGYGAPNPSCHADSTTPAYTSMQVDYIRVSP